MKWGLKGGISIVTDFGPLTDYFDAVVVFVTNSSLLFRLAVAILSYVSKFLGLSNVVCIMYIYFTAIYLSKLPVYFPVSNGEKKSKWFFQVDVSSKKWTNEFYLTTMKPQVDLFLFVYWRKLKTPKRHFEIIWPVESIELMK